MNRILVYISFLAVLGCTTSKDSVPTKEPSISNSKWEKKELLFSYDGNENWEDKWFLDGMRAKISYHDRGMLFEAGEEYKNDTCHAVLWTRESFSGNILIEYEYTREDTSSHGVNIIYFLATGSGEEGFPSDVYEWREYRTVPTMSKYFRNMNTFHISYSTGPDQSNDKDYLRLRRYDPALQKLKGSDISPDYFDTGLFKTGVTYKIEISKFNDRITMKVSPKEADLNLSMFIWDVSQRAPCEEGRIGLRHMYTRKSSYKDFRVWGIAK